MGNPKPELLYRYETVVADSERWKEFPHRAGDIIVCTPPKCGTTWVQMLCALLVHQSDELPLPLTRLSRWIDRRSEPIAQVAAELGSQPFRRVLKTHTPLDGLPYFADVFYVVCGRDPRDAFLSMMDHFANTSAKTMAEIAIHSPEAGMPPDDPNVLFPAWLTVGAHPWLEDGFPYGSSSHLIKTFWEFRHLPNIVFFHYSDLKHNLDAEMRRLSDFLGIAVNESRWPQLVHAASFAAMKGAADDLAPGAHNEEWASNADFFRMGRMGQWREVLSAENQALYEQTWSARLDHDLKRWMEEGSNHENRA